MQLYQHAMLLVLSVKIGDAPHFYPVECTDICDVIISKTDLCAKTLSITYEDYVINFVS